MLDIRPSKKIYLIKKFFQSLKRKKKLAFFKKRKIRKIASKIRINELSVKLSGLVEFES